MIYACLIFSTVCHAAVCRSKRPVAAAALPNIMVKTFAFAVTGSVTGYPIYNYVQFTRSRHHTGQREHHGDDQMDDEWRRQHLDLGRQRCGGLLH